MGKMSLLFDLGAKCLWLPNPNPHFSHSQEMSAYTNIKVHISLLLADHSLFFVLLTFAAMVPLRPFNENYVTLIYVSILRILKSYFAMRVVLFQRGGKNI